MLGAEQRAWLLEDLATTKRRWNVIAQQTAFGPFNRQTATRPLNFGTQADNWDGYVAERQAILDWAVEQQTPNPVVLTGDSHNNWIRNIPPHYRSLEGDPVVTELLGTSISSGGDPANPFVRYSEPFNPQIAFHNNNRGYVRCSVTPDTWTAEFRVVDTVKQPEAPTRSLATFVIENGRAGAVPA
jgi:alkaline phosphatase D